MYLIVGGGEVDVIKMVIQKFIIMVNLPHETSREFSVNSIIRMDNF